MPTTTLRGVSILYRIVGDRGPFLALVTGGRRGHDEFVPLAEKIAAAASACCCTTAATPAPPIS
jgi:hypothetical protein